MVNAIVYVVLVIYIVLMVGAGLIGTLLYTINRNRSHETIKEYMGAGSGFAVFTLFWTMCAALYSGYSISGIVNEAYGTGWTASRWIPAGVGVYLGFLLMASRMHALGRGRGYVTLPEMIFERYRSPAGPAWMAHALRVICLLCLQLPVFTYLITQFKSVGAETETFTQGNISSTAAVLVCASILLVSVGLGGMRAVAYRDIVQGIILVVGSVVFLVVQRTELGGLGSSYAFYSNPANKVVRMTHVPDRAVIVSYWDFIFKTMIAATMFPHLHQRLFVARSAGAMRKGLAMMCFTFFIVQLSSMLTGWVAIGLFKNTKAKTAVFGRVLLLLSARGTGQAFWASLLLAAAICAMTSTADAALLAFNNMWVRDFYKAYVRRTASEREQLWFGRVISTIGLAIGVALGLLSIHTGKPDLSGLFSLQSVTPIHVAPAVWLGLHWRGLRAEAVFVGLICGLVTTCSMVFNSSVNIKYKAGDDLTKSGLSTATIGFLVNFVVTVVLGVAMQFAPWLFCGLVRTYEVAKIAVDGEAEKGRDLAEMRAAELKAPMGTKYLNVGLLKDPIVFPPFVVPTLIAVATLCAPIYFKPASAVGWVGYMASWCFISLMLSGVMAIMVAYCFMFRWRDYGVVASTVEHEVTLVDAGEAKQSLQPSGNAVQAIDDAVIDKKAATDTAHNLPVAS